LREGLSGDGRGQLSDELNRRTEGFVEEPTPVSGVGFFLGEKVELFHLFFLEAG
jgi:hypothetical protein